MREPGGRTIERSVTLPVDPKEQRLGLKAQFANDLIGEGETANFDVIMLDGEGRPAAAGGIRWELVRLDTRWQWYSRDGQWAYEAVTATRQVANGTIDVGADKPARINAKVDWGRYPLEGTPPGPDAPVSSLLF